MEKKQWINHNGQFSFSNAPRALDNLPVGVYELNFSPPPIGPGFFLVKIADKFILPKKVYGTEETLIDRIINTFNRVNKNFGVLLQGLKGTGKTITAKIVSNSLKVPVILVNKAYPDMGPFINAIDENLVLFFDEFEKVYEFNSWRGDDDEDEDPSKKPGVSGLLTLMDGVFTSEKKRLFLLTTNKSFLPDALLSRPSRIRYIKQFGDLSYDNIIEILNDSVENKKLIPGLVEILKKLEIITVDIVKAIAEEANIYNTDDHEFFRLFNVKHKDTRYDIYMNDEEDPRDEGMDIERWNLKVGRVLSIAGEYYIILQNNMDEEEKHLMVAKQGKEEAATRKKPLRINFRAHRPVHHAFDYAY